MRLRVLHPFLVVALREVNARVGAPALFALQRARERGLDAGDAEVMGAMLPDMSK